MADLFDNPLGLMGFEFLEFASPALGVLKPVFERMGFTLVAKHRSKDVVLYRQGDINFIVNREPKSVVGFFTAEHGPSACGVAFRIKDSHRAYRRALQLGAQPIELGPGPAELNLPAILRRTMEDGLRVGSPRQTQFRAALHAQAQVEMGLPCDIGDYTDFYTSIHHATAIGKQLRPDNPLLPNYKGGCPSATTAGPPASFPAARPSTGPTAKPKLPTRPRPLWAPAAAWTRYTLSRPCCRARSCTGPGPVDRLRNAPAEQPARTAVSEKSFGRGCSS